MSDEKAILAAIWEHPHEDTPRLVYADWLQENGQPDRAEFIRVQIEAANLSRFDPLRVHKGRRARQLLGQHVEEWTESFDWVFAGLQPVAWDETPSSPTRIWETAVGVTGLQPGKSFPAESNAPEVRFERGFISLVTAGLAVLLDQSTDNHLRLGPRPEISVMWPHGETRVEPDDVLPALLERLTFERFSGWQFVGPGSFGDSGLETFCNSPALAAGLTSLGAPYGAALPTLRRVLLLTKRLTHLSSALHDEQTSALLPFIRAVIESKVNEGVTDFDAVNLFPEFLDVATVLAGLAAAQWPKLSRLLVYCWSGDSCLAAGITGNPFPQLEQLTLLGSGIGRSQLTAVLECPAFRHARVEYYEHGKRPDLRDLEERYAPRFKCEN